MGRCFAFTLPAGANLILSSYFPQDLRTKGTRCGAKINALALVIFLLRISIMLRPKQAEGEFEKFVTFLLMAFKSRKIG